jgi:CO/xanthine dehydrogenase Mo-binding subunit
VLGTRPIRHDGWDKVTGAARYGADIQLPGMLYGMILRSPHAHARLRSLNTSKAAALPGVWAVATAADFPIMARGGIDFAQLQGNARMIAENVLAQAKVLYKGHAVAAVAATDRHIAEDALKLIEVDYELLPVVLTLHDAMQPEAPLLHEEMTTRFRVERFVRGDDTGVKSNIAGHIQHRLGDVEAGFRQADVIVEREITTQSVHHGYIEPHVTTAAWSPDGHLTIWTSTQGAFAIRSSTAAILGMPESQVKVIPVEIGGGFGGKAVTYLDPVAAVLAKKSGRPVKIVMTRQGVFDGTGPASATHMRAKIGATQDGKIMAGQFYLAFEAGAFPGSPVGGGALTGFGPYKIEHLLVDGYDVVCNKTDTIGYTATTGGSRIAFDTGLAAIAAAQEVKQHMAARAALLWKRPVEEVAFNDGLFTCTTHPAERLSFRELAGKFMSTGGAVICSASANSTGVGPIFAGNIVDVEVDPETGKVQLLRYTTFLDAGCAVHPSYVEGQMQGGTVQGIG